MQTLVDNDYNDYNDYRDSDLDSDLDSIRNSCDVIYYNSELLHSKKFE